MVGFLSGTNTQKGDIKMYKIDVTQNNGNSWGIMVDDFSVTRTKKAIYLMAITHQEHFDGSPVPECYEWDDIKKIKIKV